MSQRQRRQIIDCLSIGICQSRFRLARWHPGHSIDIAVCLTMRSCSKVMISTLRFVIVTIMVESAGRFRLKGFPELLLKPGHVSDVSALNPEHIRN